MIKKCPYCGEFYDGYSYNVTCGREECQHSRRMEMHRAWMKQNRRKRKTPLERLAQDAKDAKTCGVSYGYYKEVLSPKAKAYWYKFDLFVKERIAEYEAARTENRPAASSY